MRIQAHSTSGPVVILFGRSDGGFCHFCSSNWTRPSALGQIARITATPAGSLYRELKILTNVGLLNSHLLVIRDATRLTGHAPVFEDLAAIFRKTGGLADVLREALMPIASDVEWLLHSWSNS